MKELKLTIELVPFTSWFNNLREVLPRPLWDKIRKETYAEYGHKSGICGRQGRLNCHEIWEYDDKKHIQKLNGFIALCDLCHHIKHFGRANMLAREGNLNLEELVEHFMRVNGCDWKTFEEYVDKAFAKWDERSQYNWEVDLGKFSRLVKSKT